MNKALAHLLLPLTLLMGCQNAPKQEPQTEVINPIPQYPTIAFTKMKVVSGSQTITAANRLADELGVEFVEWSKGLNPYEYYQLRSKRINLTYDDPQAAFLELFDRSGLLAHYEKNNNAVVIYPYSLDIRLNTPHIFTPKFERSEKQEKQIVEAYEDDLVGKRKAIEYHYYTGYTIKDTFDAWANYANYKGVIWYIQDNDQVDFLYSKLKKDDSVIGSSPFNVLTTFIKGEMDRSAESIPAISISLDQQRKLLIVHPYHESELVRAFDIEPSSVKYNMKRIADFYGYSLDYRAQDYEVLTGYTTVLSTYTEESINNFLQQYPLQIEIIDSTKKIIVRGK